MRQMHGAHQNVRQALVAFVLEMMLGEPQRVVAALVHRLGDRFGLVEDRSELVVRITPIVRRGGILIMVGDVDMTGIHRHEFVDHGLSSPGKGWRRCRLKTRTKRKPIPEATRTSVWFVSSSLSLRPARRRARSPNRAPTFASLGAAV